MPKYRTGGGENGAGEGEQAREEAQVYAAAARGADGSVAVMLANPGGAEAPIALEVGGRRQAYDSKGEQQAYDSKGEQQAYDSKGERQAYNSKIGLSCRIIDETRTWEEVSMPKALPPHSVLLVETEAL